MNIKLLLFVPALLFSGCNKPNCGPAKKVFNAAGANWSQYAGKKVSNMRVNKYGNDLTITFEDGTELKISNYKYPLDVN